MKALVTGASSGIGRDMAVYLALNGWDIIIVARRIEKLYELKEQIKNVNVTCIQLDLAEEENCYELYNQVKGLDIDMLVNNAGFGIFGVFAEIPLEKELELINTNIKAVHILSKLFLNDFIRRDSGYILNVASYAGFASGPLLGSYYASKSYVVRLSEAIYEELRRSKSNVSISVLCPGPVKTEFNKVAHVKFALNGLNSFDVAKLAIDKTFKRKLIIIPGVLMKLAKFFQRFISEKAVARLSHNIQKKKN